MKLDLLKKLIKEAVKEAVREELAIVLSEDIKCGKFGDISACINLELTGLGKHIWVSSFEKFEDISTPPPFKEVGDDLNESEPDDMPF